MRKAIQYEYGGPEVLRIIEADRPEPGPGEVLVRVRAASVNFGETKLRTGVAKAGPLPFTLGSDLSGTVEATGPGASRFQPGDEVYGVRFVGTYAEYVAVQEDGLALKPDVLDHVGAAALPVAGLTALAAVEEARCGPGQRILIHAAAGGVGHLAVQLAKEKGAFVLATARAAKHDFLAGLGADEVVDYTTTDFTQAVRDVDVVFDLVGGAYGPRSLDSLRPGGLLLSAVLDPGLDENEAEKRGMRYKWVSLRPTSSELEKLTDLVTRGKLRPHVERTYPLEELTDAHRAADAGRVTGKLVVTV
ncbi:NADP-dependent oxidoreductase [Streptomyces sp. NBC_00102]|uniref:NADP-dependent oxidoreductase n=1 Tax=Streptomyces sp. NBC_00102 TaxID=2975652 RepID=UPI002253BBBA|nr:NADP-dependent oxidoreductase [Streptomyces sp. NBC_00102]MCX5399887.1 NADP-dependent oxidoreductase [Streptomyces sp. NBC_00102]